MTVLTPDVIDTLAKAASELDLFDKVAAAVRALEVKPGAGVSHVVASPSRGEIIVIADDYTHVALRVIA